MESPEMGSSEILKSNSDQDSDFADFESERNPDFSDFKSEKDPVVSCQDNSDSGGSLQDKEEMKIETETAFDDVIQDRPKTEMETTMQDETEDHEIESKDESVENEQESKDEEPIQLPDEHPFNSDNE